ncbi:MAG: PAS domain S-box protein [Deltaproteobacteria bacterium]|nr:PAS domain S-box protein [Deltaproteobacteria bacterium]
MEADTTKQVKEKTGRMKKSQMWKGRETEDMPVSNLFFKTLFEGIHEEIMVIDKDFLIQDVNRVFLDNHGLRKEEAVGKKCHAIIYGSDSPCQWEKTFCPLEKAKETGERVEVTHCRELEGGGSRELALIMYPVPFKGKTPQYFVEISRDVTEYRDLIKRLQASEMKFKAILDTATDAILSINEKQEIVLFNDSAQRIFGYSGDEALGMNLHMLIPPKYGDHYRHVQRFLETRTPRVIGKTLPLTALRKGGKEFPIELGLSYHETGGDITFTAIIRDMSAQKRMEKTLLRSERLAAVGQAVAHVAHEIKNPLMVIGGFSHQIRKSIADDKAAQKLDMVLDEIHRLESLVANLGDFTKEYKLVKRPADINAVIRDVLKMMGGLYDGEKYPFKVHLSSDLKEIDCDPDKLKQVFINVIKNGIEAMEEGGTITVSSQEWGRGIEIHIGDEGVGMGEEDQLHIFEPFYTTRERGSGLGLSISYKIVEAHNGEIWALSLPGEGTTFIIRIPAT